MQRLLNDGNNTYAYDSANRLIAMSGPFGSNSYGYNGLGDRLTQNGVNYTLDLNAGLTQVLNDGTNQYLYGAGRIAQVNTETEYFLGDALGSVRQLTDSQGNITLANAYQPYGDLAQTTGSAQTSYGFTGEFTDPSGMMYLRARYYMPDIGRFSTKDIWGGSSLIPNSYNKFNYAYSNPLRYLDPSGMITIQQADEADDIVEKLRTKYNVIIEKDWGYQLIPYGLYYFGCEWEEGNWRSLRELRLIKQTVTRIAEKMGGESKFRSAMREIKIKRLDFNGYAMSVPQPINIAFGDLRIPNLLFDYSDNWAKYILTHELGHKWDFEKNYSLSKGLMQALGTWICNKNGGECRWEPYAQYLDPITLELLWERPAGISLSCTGQPPFDCPEPYALTYGLSGRQPWESILEYFRILPGIDDWAESFANYIYPGYYSSQRLSILVPGGIRQNYVRKQMDSLP